MQYLQKCPDKLNNFVSLKCELISQTVTGRKDKLINFNWYGRTQTQFELNLGFETNFRHYFKI